MKTTNTHLPCRIGHGYDLHRLEPHPPDGNGQPLILCGISVEHTRGPVAHSDGDAPMHAITDAILGALGEPDIGEIFPDNSPKWKEADSSIFVKEAAARAAAAGYEIANMDITIILQEPRISPIKDRMRTNIAQLLNLPPSRINIKGKSHEHVDAVGRGEAIEVHVVTLLTLKIT